MLKGFFAAVALFSGFSQILSAAAPDWVRVSLEQELEKLPGAQSSNLHSDLELLHSYLQNSTADAKLGLSMVLADLGNPSMAKLLQGQGFEISASAGSNWALYLLIFLLRESPTHRTDSILFALALSRNRLYAISDQETRKIIEAELLWRLDFYDQVRARQEKIPGSLNLSLAPLTAKLHWADPSPYIELPEHGVWLGAERYREFITSPATWMKIFTLSQALDGQVFIDNQAMMLQLESEIEKRHVRLDHLGPSREYYPIHPSMKKEEIPLFEKARQDMAVYYSFKRFGRERSWGEVYWLNAQMDIYEKHGFFLGDCVTVSLLQRALSTVMGIPALGLRVKSSESETYYWSHNFPAYYDLCSDSYQSLQFPVEWMERAVLSYQEPAWHHKLNLYNGLRVEKSNRDIIRLLQHGIGREYMDLVLFAQDSPPEPPSHCFECLSAALLDRAEEGLRHQSESRLGRKVGQAESKNTGWYDVSGIMGKNPAASIKDARGDGVGAGEVWDLIRLEAYHSDQAFYLKAFFSAETAKNLFTVHSLNVDNNDTKERWFIQWKDPLRATAYKWVDGKQLPVPLPYSAFATVWLKDSITFILRCDILGSGRSFSFKYYSGAHDEKRVPRVAADTSDWLTISL